MTETQIAFSSPVYCMTNYKCPSFLDRATRISPQLVISGGGGSGKSGIANYIAIGGIKRSADGILHFKELVMMNTEADLVHQVQPASNGRFIFGSLRDGTVIYRAVRGSNDQLLKLERVLFQSTDVGNKALQNIVIAKSDDVSLLTGGEEGTLRSWQFGLKKNDPSRSCELVQKEKLNLFDNAITSIVLNPTELFCFVGCDRGEIAVIDLQSNGITQRIIPPSPTHCKVQQLLFHSTICLIVLYTFRNGSSRIQLFKPVSERETIHWKKTHYRDFSKQTICRFNLCSNEDKILLGTNDGDVSVITYPDLNDYMKCISMHGLPVTSLTFLSSTDSLISLKTRIEKGDEYKKTVNRNIEDEGWVVSSSVDYTLSLQPLKHTAKMVWMVKVFYLLTLFVIIAYGMYMLRK